MLTFLRFRLNHRKMRFVLQQIIKRLIEWKKKKNKRWLFLDSNFIQNRWENEPKSNQYRCIISCKTGFERNNYANPFWLLKRQLIYLFFFKFRIELSHLALDFIAVGKIWKWVSITENQMTIITFFRIWEYNVEHKSFNIKTDGCSHWLKCLNNKWERRESVSGWANYNSKIHIWVSA